MQLPAGSIWVIICWALAALVVWHLYRFGQAFEKKSHLRLQVFLATALLAVVGFLKWQELNWLPATRPRLIIFPLAISEGRAPQITSRSLALAQLISDNLQHTKSSPFHVIPPSAIFDIVEFDSLARVGYLKKLSHVASFKYSGIGAIIDIGEKENLDFRFYARENAAPLIELRLPLDGDDPSISRKISAAILQQLKLAYDANGFAAAEMMSPTMRSAYFDGQFFLATKKPALAYDLARGLVRADSTNAVFVELLTAAGMKKLIAKNANRLEWRDSLDIWIPLLRRVCKQDSMRAIAARLLGQAYLQLGEWYEADLALQRAFKVNPEDGELCVAISYLHASRYAAYGFKSAIELFRFALDLNPGDVTAALHAADNLFYENHAQDAIKLLEDLREINPNHFDILMALAKYYVVKHEQLKVLEISERLLTLQPQNADIFYNLGIAYYDSEDDDNAIQFFKRAITLNNHRNARLYLAHIYERRGDIPTAIHYLRERLRLREDDKDLYADEAGKHLYKLLRARGELPPHLLPDSLLKNIH